jgi:hypothetical protein
MSSWNTIDEIHALYLRGELSPPDIISRVASAVEEKEPSLNAFINLFLEEAESHAFAIGSPPQPLPPLWGIRTTSATRITRQHALPESSSATGLPTQPQPSPGYWMLAP